MRRCISFVIFIVGFFSTSVAQSQTPELFPHIGIDASLPFQHTNNALNASSDRQGDSFTSPFFKVSFGQLKPSKDNIVYSIYASANIDAFSRVKDAQDGLAAFGGNLVFLSGNFKYGGIYEHNLIYDGIFRQRALTAEDFTGFVTYKYNNKDAGLVINTSFTPAYRFADERSAERALYTFKLDIKKHLVGDYYAVATPKLRIYQYTQDINAGRRDIRPSVSGGIEYDINDDVSLTTSIEYDTRTSNFTGKNYSSLAIGASLDFSHTFDRSK